MKTTPYKDKHKEEFGMWVNWKRFSFGALLLASLSLLLFGCGDFKGSQVAQKTMSGSVSGITGSNAGFALEGATITAYGVDGAGKKLATPLAGSTTATSDAKGLFRLTIPTTYTGIVILKAVPPTTPAKLVQKLIAKIANLPADDGIYAAIPPNVVNQPSISAVMISFATNTVFQYINANSANVLTSDNIRQATAVLETFFGANFTTTPPLDPTADTTNTSPAQLSAERNLAVQIQAVNSLNSASNQAGVQLATVLTALGSPSGIDAQMASTIRSGIDTAIAALQTQNVIPVEFVKNNVIDTTIANAVGQNVSVVDVSDITPPSAPAQLVATVKGPKSVHLTWLPSTDNTAVTGYFVSRADATGTYTIVDTLDAATLVNDPNDASKLAYDDFSVAPANSYSYQIVAFDKARNLSTPSSAAAVLTMAAADSIPPAAPGNVKLNYVDQNTVKFQWDPAKKLNPDGTSGYATGYNVYRNDVLVSTAQTDTTFTDSVSPGTSYNYYVKALDSFSNLSQPSTVLPVTTLAPPPTISAVSITDGSSSTTTTISISWNAPNSVNNFVYNLYRDSVLTASGITATSFDDFGLKPNTSYSYQVVAVAMQGTTELGRSPMSAVAKKATLPMPGSTPPLPPVSIGVTFSSKSVLLAWANAVQPSGVIVAGYDIIRVNTNTSSMVGQVKIATVTTNQFIDTTIEPNQPYTYYLQPFNTDGVRSLTLSAPTTVTTAPPVDPTDTTAPNAPPNLAFTLTGNTVTLTWGAATKSNTSATRFVSGYKLYRDGNQIADTGLTLLYTDNLTTPDTPYVYTVKAYDNSGNLSAPSTGLAVRTPAAVPNKYNIAGQVTVNGVALFGVTVSNGTTSVVTDTNGFYTFVGLDPGTYTLTPSLSNFYVFNPGSLTVKVTSANVNGQNFAATNTGSTGSAVTYPNGTVIGGISFPAGTVINGVTYPAGTIIGGVFYPTGTVIGGVSYPNGVVIGGVTYPAGTIVGGIAFPVGAITTGVTTPSGNVIGGVFYPTGSTVTTVGYPTGVVVGGVVYASGTVNGGVVYPTAGIIVGQSYPTGSVSGGISYPVGSVLSGLTFPSGSLVGGITFPTGTVVINGVTYPTSSTVIGGVTYPSGSVVGGVLYPNGVVIGGVNYPAGTVVGGVALPVGVLTTNIVAPSGTVIGGVLYPTGTVLGGVIAPSGTAIGTITIPSGIMMGGVFYPTGTIAGGLLYPSASVAASTSYPNGSILGGITYPTGSVVINGVTYPTSSTVIGGVTYPTGSVVGGILYPNGVVIGGVNYPAGTVVGGVALPVGTVTAGIIAPDSTVIGGVSYPTGTVINGVIAPSGTVIGTISVPTGVVIGNLTYPSGILSLGFVTPGGTISGTTDYSTPYMLSGTVTLDGTTSVSGVAVTLDGSSTTAYSGTFGAYLFHVAFGPHTVALQDYPWIAPQTQSYPNSAPLNFTVSPGVYGKIMNTAGQPMAGVTVTFGGTPFPSNPTYTTVTDGIYYQSTSTEGTCTITPGKANYTFAPVLFDNTSVPVSASSSTSRNFVGTYTGP